MADDGEMIYVKIVPGRGSHTTPDGELHRSFDDDPVFPIDVAVYDTFNFKFIPCDPDTGSEIVPEIKTTTGLKAKVKAAAQKTVAKPVRPTSPKK